MLCLETCCVYFVFFMLFVVKPVGCGDEGTALEKNPHARKSVRFVPHHTLRNFVSLEFNNPLRSSRPWRLFLHTNLGWDWPLPCRCNGRRNV